MVPRGLEPRTLRPFAARSSQRSYETSRPVGGARCLVFDSAPARGRTHITADPRRGAERGSMLNFKLLKTVTARRDDPPRARAWNLRLRRPTPYPLGQQAMCQKRAEAR